LRLSGSGRFVPADALHTSLAERQGDFLIGLTIYDPATHLQFMAATATPERNLSNRSPAGELPCPTMVSMFTNPNFSRSFE
jgi:hypothetical protein